MPEGADTILVVDDERDILALFGEFLSMSTDAETILCASGADVQRSLEEGAVPTVALIDFNLKGPTSSIDVCRMIRLRAPACTFFMISGTVQAARKNVPEDIPIQGFFQKPFAFSDILERLNTSLQTEKRRTLGLTPFPVIHQEQLESLYHLLKMAPDDPAVRHMLAFGLYTASRYRDALREYEGLLATGYKSFLAFYYAGHCYARLRLYERACETWAKCAALAPSEEAAAKVEGRIQQVHELLAAEKRLHEASIVGEGEV